MILSARFWDDLDLYRILYIGGPFGSGKTLLSVAIAEGLYRRGYRIFGNFRIAFNSDFLPDLLEKGLYKAVVVLDEAGSRYLDSRKWSSKESSDLLSVADYARKQDLVFIFPTATQVDKRARRLSVIRNVGGRRFLQSAGLDDFLWHYWVYPSVDSQYSMWLFAPFAYYDIYTTKEMVEAQGDALGYLLQDFQRRFGVNREAVEAARSELIERLRAGEVVPGFR